jgi:hypothetical protein
MSEKRKRPSKGAAEREAREWNEKHPIGTPVRFWSGTREGAGSTGETRSGAFVQCDHASVLVTGSAGSIALSHVESLVCSLPDETQAAFAAAGRWNITYPVGTPVRYWTEREGNHYEGVTGGPAFLEPDSPVALVRVIGSRIAIPPLAGGSATPAALLALAAAVVALHQAPVAILGGESGTEPVAACPHCGCNLTGRHDTDCPLLAPLRLACQIMVGDVRAGTESNAAAFRRLLDEAIRREDGRRRAGDRLASKHETRVEVLQRLREQVCGERLDV